MFPFDDVIMEQVRVFHEDEITIPVSSQCLGVMEIYVYIYIYIYVYIYVEFLGQLKHDTGKSA